MKIVAVLVFQTYVYLCWQIAFFPLFPTLDRNIIDINDCEPLLYPVSEPGLRNDSMVTTSQINIRLNIFGYDPFGHKMQISTGVNKKPFAW